MEPGERNIGSGLFNCDGARLTNFNAALAAKALFGVDRNGLAIFHFENLNRTNIHALFATLAFFRIDSRNKSH
jgi:hypothetical protein